MDSSMAVAVSIALGSDQIGSRVHDLKIFSGLNGPKHIRQGRDIPHISSENAPGMDS